MGVGVLLRPDLFKLLQVIGDLGNRGPIMRRRGPVALGVAAIQCCVASGRQIRAVAVSAIGGGERSLVGGMVTFRGDPVAGVGLDVTLFGGL